MRFPHPKGNIPIRMRQRGQPGITIDRSTDTVSIFHCDWQNWTWASCWQFIWRPAAWQASLGTGNLPPSWCFWRSFDLLIMMLQASLGTGSLPPGWEKGLAGSCVGERRWTSCQSFNLHHIEHCTIILIILLSWCNTNTNHLDHDGNLVAGCSSSLPAWLLVRPASSTRSPPM